MEKLDNSGLLRAKRADLSSPLPSRSDGRSSQLDLRECLAFTGCTGLGWHQCQDGHEVVFSPNGGTCPRCHSNLKSMYHYMRHHSREWRRAMRNHVAVAKRRTDISSDGILAASAAFALYGWFLVHSAVVMALF